MRLRARLAAVLGLARTQHLEVSRQPVFGVVLLAGLALVGLAPALAVFSLGHRAAEAFVVDLGASSMLFVAVFLAAAAVAAGAAERLADGTTLLVLTHPVSPLALLAGQLLGGVLALGQASLLLGVALLWAARHGPHELHWGVLAAAGAAALGAIAWGIRASLAGRGFQAAALTAASMLFPALYLGSLFLDRGLAFLPVAEPIHGTAAAAAFLAWLASLTFAALGLALATRLPPEAAAALTLIAFLLGSIVRAGLGEGAEGVAWGLGMVAAGGGVLWLLTAAFRTSLGWGFACLLPPVALAFAIRHRERGAAAVVLLVVGLAVAFFGEALFAQGVLTLVIPDLQLFWIADAAYTGQLVPLDYVLELTAYTSLYALGALGCGAFLLSGRELAG